VLFRSLTSYAVKPYRELYGICRLIFDKACGPSSIKSARDGDGTSALPERRRRCA
jgi:hypothetical protein